MNRTSKQPHLKTSKKKQCRANQSAGAKVVDIHGGKFEAERALPPIKALNPKQAEYLEALAGSPQTIVLGPAGTGKTWIAATFAADLYRQRRIERIILTRPNVPCGRSLGFFPGTVENKFAPWAVPVTDAIKERIGVAAFDIAMRRGDIEMVPFEVMRGRSWRNAFVLLAVLMHASYTGWLLAVFPATSPAQSLIWQTAFAAVLWLAAVATLRNSARDANRPPLAAGSFQQNEVTR